MAAPDPDALAATLRDALAPFDDVRLAVLYGSGADGRLGPDSDVDVGVAARAPLTADRRVEIARALAAATGREVDLVDLSVAGYPLLEQVLTTGRVVLCHDDLLHAGLVRRMLLDGADFGPLHRRILAERRARLLHG